MVGDHVAAFRGIWDGKKWHWFFGMLHDEFAARYGVKVVGRYRAQQGMMLRIEFEPGCDVVKALEAFVSFFWEDMMDAPINIVWDGKRVLSIREALKAFGVSKV